MQTYEKYKDSGVAWIGEIPYHWDVVSLKRSLRIKNGCDYKTIQVDEGGYPVIGSGGEFARASKYLYDGEVVLLGRKGTIDKPLYYEGQFWVVDTMFYGIPLNNCFGKYLYFQSRTIPFNRYSTNTALPSMTQTDLNSHSICLPTFAEQQCIASYLDKKCADIDKVIATQQRRIELLQELKQSTITHAVTHGLNPNVKMKDSGVEWIGEVPEHWELIPFKYISDIIMGQSPSGDDIKSEGKQLFMQGNADFSSLYPQPSLYCDKCKKFSRVGDVLMSVRAPVGELNISDRVYGIGRGLCSIKSKEISQRYLWYLLIKSKSDFSCFTTGSTFDAISIQILKSFISIIPSFSEQQAITTYLDKKCAELDASISKAQKEIDLLQEYKQALITEVVTGKRKVC